MTVSPVAGLTAEVPAFARIHDRIMTITARLRNSQNGCGSLLPAFSMKTRERMRKLRLSSVLPGGEPCVPAAAVDIGRLSASGAGTRMSPPGVGTGSE